MWWTTGSTANAVHTEVCLKHLHGLFQAFAMIELRELQPKPNSITTYSARMHKCTQHHLLVVELGFLELWHPGLSDIAVAISPLYHHIMSYLWMLSSGAWFIMILQGLSLVPSKELQEICIISWVCPTFKEDNSVATSLLGLALWYQDLKSSKITYYKSA